MIRYIFDLEDRFVEGVRSRCFGGEPEALVTSGVQKCLDVGDFCAVFMFEDRLYKIAFGLDVFYFGE